MLGGCYIVNNVLLLLLSDKWFKAEAKAKQATITFDINSNHNTDADVDEEPMGKRRRMFVKLIIIYVYK